MNVIEIDAASNNGVDNIRQIREEVEYRPTEGKYKVYIIDEVHMLSIGAFNALLRHSRSRHHMLFYSGNNGGTQDTDHNLIPLSEIRFQAYFH